MRATRPGRAERGRLLAGLALPPALAAPFLLGQHLVHRDRGLVLRIVETEAYLGEGDPAAHAWHGRTRRTDALWGPAGTLYVYFIYGMHHCLNLAVDQAGVPGCVLIRAAEILAPRDAVPGSATGPGRLCRLLGLDTTHSGLHLFDAAGPLTLREAPPPVTVATGPRVGIRKAADMPLRFVDAQSRAVSRPFIR